MNQTDWEARITWSKVVAGCVIRRDDGKYLLVQEKQPKAYGLWCLPAGHVDKGETIEAAAVREAKEETGYDVELGEKIDIYHETVEAAVKHAFTARIIGGELLIQPDEILDARWFSFDELTGMHEAGSIRAPWIYLAVQSVQSSYTSTTGS